MRWASSISDAGAFDDAVEHTADALARRLDGAAPHLLLVFATTAHQSRWHELPARLRARFPGALVVGCSASGVIGDGREIEEGPGLAIAAAALPGVELTAFHVPTERTPDPVDADADATAIADARARWCEAIGIDDGPDPHLLLFPDPFTWTGPELLASLDRAFPSGVKVGGLSSGGGRPGENRLFCDRSSHHRGLVGLALRGNLEIETAVGQGCRPIGNPMFVTRRKGTVIYELDGRPAIEVLQHLLGALGPEDRKRARSSLFLGVSMHPSLEVHHRGDFLIRNLVGIDPTTGAIGTAAQLDGNPIVQFHLRDPSSSADELTDLLTDHAEHTASTPSRVALLFSCVGRGIGHYGRPDHDSALIREQLGRPKLPIVGFFGNGEIGPIAGRTFLHGYTSAITFVRPATVI